LDTQITTSVSVQQVTFESPGVYEITLTVTDNEGATGTKTEKFLITTCGLEGNVWDDDKCKPLPNIGNQTGEGSALIKADGTFGSSNAKFSGGWSFNGGDYESTKAYNGEKLSLASVIRFAPEYVGKTVDIVIPLDIQLSPPFGQHIWFHLSDTDGFILWDFNIRPYNETTNSGLAAFMNHEIKEYEPLILGPYNLGRLEGFLISDISFYFGYRLSNGELHFGGLPIVLKVR
jgi:PKD repeat protein